MKLSYVPKAGRGDPQVLASTWSRDQLGQTAGLRCRSGQRKHPERQIKGAHFALF